jgi:hypothetical protein
VRSDDLGQLLDAHLPEATRAWWKEALAEASRGLGSAGFAPRWSAAGRRLGTAVMETNAVAGRWAADELGRAVLLLSGAQATSAEELPRAVEELFRTGEMREQQAVLKVLGYLPGPERFVVLATEAVRSNVVPVLEALACDNPFPAAHMPEPAFNQLVMKSLFNGLALSRVLGLAARVTPELRRMVDSYASERRAAGRPVPPDVDLIQRSR